MNTLETYLEYYLLFKNRNKIEWNCRTKDLLLQQGGRNMRSSASQEFIHIFYDSIDGVESSSPYKYLDQTHRVELLR